MVFGCSSAVRKLPLVYQCADTAITARGFGSVAASSLKAFDQRLSSIAFIGEPWPTNRAGMRLVRLLVIGRIPCARAAAIAAATEPAARRKDRRVRRAGTRASWPGRALPQRRTRTARGLVFFAWKLRASFFRPHFRVRTART